MEEEEEDEEVLTFVNLRYSVSTSALVATRAGQYGNEFILAQTTSPVFSCSTFDMGLNGSLCCDCAVFYFLIIAIIFGRKNVP